MASFTTFELPTGRTGRWTALGLLFVVLAVLWLGIAGPLLEWHRVRADALEPRAVLALRMAQLVAGLPRLELAAQDAMPSGPRAEALLTQSSDAVAAAALLEAVQDMATQAGARLSSTETLPTEAAGRYRRIRLRITLSAPLPAVVALLRALAQASPRMLVDDLQLRAAPVLAGRDSPPIDASMLVLAFRAAEPTQ